MAQGIYFNGRFTVVPGSYTEVDASALAGGTLGATGIVACIGEAEGGAPHDTTIYEVANPGQIGKLFRDGDLREAGVMLFDASNDDRIGSGAQEVKFAKVNPATRSFRTFIDGSAADALTLTSRDYGAFTTRIGIDIAAGTVAGKLITVNFEDRAETFDNVGADPKFTLAWGGTVGLNVVAALALSGSLTIALDEVAITDKRSDYLGVSNFTGQDGAKTASPTAGEVAIVVSSLAADTTQSIVVYGIDNGTGNPVSEVIALNGTTPVSGSVLWSAIHGYRLSAACEGTITISGTTPGTLATIAPAGLSAGLVLLGDSAFNDPATGYEVNGGALTFVADGATAAALLVVGYAGGVATLEQITLDGTTPVATTTTDWEFVNFVAAIEVPAARTITASGLIWNASDVVEIVSSSAADVQAAVVYGTSPAGVPQTEAVVLDGLTPVQTVAAFGQVTGVVLAAPASGSVTVRSPDAAVTVFVVSPTDHAAGVHVWSGVQNSEGVAVAFANVGTGTAVVYGTDDAGAAVGEVVAGASSSTLFKSITAVTTSHMDAGQTLDIAYTLAAFPATNTTIQQVFNTLNAAYTGLVVVVDATDAATLLLSDLDAKGATVLTAAPTSYGAVLHDVVAAINQGSGLVAATRATGGSAGPANTATTTFLAGGVEGATTFAHWQAALDNLRDYRVNTIVVLTDDEAVHAAVLAHCAYMAGAGKSERDAKLGAASGQTFAQLKSRSQALNSRHCSLFVQDIVRFNQRGVREQFPPAFTACVAAGMQAGSAVGTALTRKYLKVLDVVGNPASYTIQDDAEKLIQAGLNVLEKQPNIGWRFLRNVTTHRKDDNAAYVEAHVNEAVNYVVYTFRTEMEALIGQKGVEATVATAQGLAVGVLSRLMDRDIRAMIQFRNLSLELTGDVLTVSVEVAPVESVNFVKSTIHLVRATFSAAA